MNNKIMIENWKPLDEINGFRVRPGFFDLNGATELSYGVNFTIHSHMAYSCELLLYRRKEKEPYAVLPFPPRYRIGDVFSMIVFDINIEDFEYAYRFDGPYDPEKGIIFDKTRPLLDPYGRAVTGQSKWGVMNNGTYHSRVVRDNFDWGETGQPDLPMDDLIIYEMHVRGFTESASSGVPEDHRGTFAGIKDKIPYLKSLGITAVELMPIFEFDECAGLREISGKKLVNYWGYDPVSFFAPNTSYTAATEYNREGTELKELIRELHDNHIEVILDVVFNHTAEGNENGPFFSFKGIDNNVYYMLTPDGYYYNFSGCGNTLNCNHPVVREMILECLRYWVIHYRVDGFRFDLASILGRNEDGSPMSKPPLLESLAFDPILGNIKLIAEAWDAGGLYQVGSFPSWNRWAEWNGKYRDDMRSFLKGDNGSISAAASRITGSDDLYNNGRGGYRTSINFLTCHDGFTLHDLYAYNEKHNDVNGWGNTDGQNDNRSWNCGAEGDTDNPDILRLRRRMARNAIAVLMCSRGIPMFLSGDEFGNSQKGNNNSYCQDNETSWLDWNDLEKNKDLFEFCKFMISFRKNHLPISRKTEPCSIGFPDMSIHNGQAWNSSLNYDSHFLAVMFAGKTIGKDDVIFLAVNTYWECLDIELPELPDGLYWKECVDTWMENGMAKGENTRQNTVSIGARSVKIFIVCRN